jgi:hypothetical protein
MNGILRLFRNGRPLNAWRPPYDDGAVAALARASERHTEAARRRRLRFLLLDSLQMAAERGESYIVEQADDRTWRELAVLVLENAVFDLDDEHGCRFAITRIGLRLLDQLIQEGIV